MVDLVVGVENLGGALESKALITVAGEAAPEAATRGI
jgi:hypothetical protein